MGYLSAKNAVSVLKWIRHETNERETDCRFYLSKNGAEGWREAKTEKDPIRGVEPANISDKEIAMTQECELLSTCGFFSKYQATKNLACKGFIAQYCKGPKMNQCKRKEYRNKYGTPPSENMMPSGSMIN